MSHGVPESTDTVKPRYDDLGLLNVVQASRPYSLCLKSSLYIYCIPRTHHLFVNASGGRGGAGGGEIESDLEFSPN